MDLAKIMEGQRARLNKKIGRRAWKNLCGEEDQTEIRNWENGLDEERNLSWASTVTILATK